MDLSVNKGGVCWVEFSLGRGPKGLDVWVRTVPQIEEFMKTVSNGKTDSLDAYGNEWYPISPTAISVYQMTKKLTGDTWTIGTVGEPLVNITVPNNGRERGLTLEADGGPKATKKVNLSFLRMVGISEGVRFGVQGPFSKDFISQFGREIVQETKNLILQYIVPVRVNLRITQQDF